MITGMRKELKKLSGILWLVVAGMIIPPLMVFIVKQPGIRNSKIALIDGDPVYASEYRSQFIDVQLKRERLRSLLQAQGYEADLFLSSLKSPGQTALDEISVNKVLDNIQENLNIQIDQKLFAEHLLKSIPYQFIGDDGRVNQAHYKLFLSKMGLTVLEYEDKQEADLKRAFVKDLITHAAYEPHNVIIDKFNKENSKKNFSILEIPFNSYLEKAKKEKLASEDLESFYEKNKEDYRVLESRSANYWTLSLDDYIKQVNIDDQQVETFYEKNKNTLFRIPPEVKVRRLTIDIDPNASISESRESMVLAKGLAQEIKNDPSKFAPLAKAHSKHPSASKGGLVDFFKRGTYEPEFEREAFKLKSIGDVIGPVRMGNKAEIIQLVDKKPAGQKPLSQVRDEITQILKTRKAMNTIKSELASVMFESRSNESALDDFVKEKALKTQAIGPVNKNTPGYELDALLAKKLFIKKQGYFEFEGKYFLYKETARKKSFIPNLSDIQDKVAHDYYSEKAIKDLQEVSSEAKSNFLSGTPLDKLNTLGGKIIKTGEVTLNDKIGAIKDSQELVGEAFNLVEPNQILRYKLGQNYYLVTLVSSKLPEKPMESDFITQESLSAKRVYLDAFIASLLRDVKIELVEKTLENIS